MRNTIYFISILTISILFSNCSKPDKDFSLLEPKFTRCHLSKEYVNGNLWKEITYKDEINFEIDRVFYYQNNQIREDWTETFTYENGKMATKTDFYNTTTYSYNDKGDLSLIKFCYNNSGACCNSDYTYNYDVNNLPSKISTSCQGGDSFTETLDYTNLDNRSYFYIYADNNGTSLSSFQKFVEQYINPNSEVSPNNVDFYQNRIIEDYKNKQFIEYLINPTDVKGHYPTRIRELIYSLPNFQQTDENVYTYDYVGCE